MTQHILSKCQVLSGKAQVEETDIKMLIFKILKIKDLFLKVYGMLTTVTLNILRI